MAKDMNIFSATQTETSPPVQPNKKPRDASRMAGVTLLTTN